MCCGVWSGRYQHPNICFCISMNDDYSCSLHVFKMSSSSASSAPCLFFLWYVLWFIIIYLCSDIVLIYINVLLWFILMIHFRAKKGKPWNNILGKKRCHLIRNYKDNITSFAEHLAGSPHSLDTFPWSRTGMAQSSPRDRAIYTLSGSVHRGILLKPSSILWLILVGVLRTGTTMHWWLWRNWLRG